MKTKNQNTEKRKYELAFVIKLEDGSVVSKSLVDRGFTILTENPLAKIQLAYPIKKENYAYFGYFHFEGEPAAIKNLRADFKINPEILRYLIITPPFIKKSISRKPIPIIAKPDINKVEFKPTVGPVLTNEALEKKIEEILK